MEKQRVDQQNFQFIKTALESQLASMIDNKQVETSDP